MDNSRLDKAEEAEAILEHLQDERKRLVNTVMLVMVEGEHCGRPATRWSDDIYN